jgi:hypothetical protein
MEETDRGLRYCAAFGWDEWVMLWRISVSVDGNPVEIWRGYLRIIIAEWYCRITLFGVLPTRKTVMCRRRRIYGFSIITQKYLGRHTRLFLPLKTTVREEIGVRIYVCKCVKYKKLLWSAFFFKIISCSGYLVTVKYSNTKQNQNRLGSGHTESGLPRQAEICARGGKAFELYYVRLHHPLQTERELTRRTSFASARLLFDGDDAVLRNTVRRPSCRGHRSLSAAAARFLCGQTLSCSKHVEDNVI